jgi:hypothetical protein
LGNFSSVSFSLNKLTGYDSEIVPNIVSSMGERSRQKLHGENAVYPVAGIKITPG